MTNEEKIELENRLTTVEQRSKSNTHAINDMRAVLQEIRELAMSVVKLTEQMKNTNESVDEIKADLRSVMSKPDAKIDAIEKAGLSAVVSAIVGAAMALILH